jgi:protein ImuA
MATDHSAIFAALRARLERMQGHRPRGGGVPVAEVVDRLLPEGAGLPRAASHEIVAAEADSGSASGFAAMFSERTRWRIATAPGAGAREYDAGGLAWRLELVKAAAGNREYGTWPRVNKDAHPRST